MEPIPDLLPTRPSSPGFWIMAVIALVSMYILYYVVAKLIWNYLKSRKQIE